MPELPDLTVYLEALEQRILGTSLSGIRLASPFVLRTAEPTVEELSGRKVLGFRRIGKRLIIELEGDYFIVIHLMIAGRLRWYQAGRKIPGKLGLLAFERKQRPPFDGKRRQRTRPGSAYRCCQRLVIQTHGTL